MRNLRWVIGGVICSIVAIGLAACQSDRAKLSTAAPPATEPAPEPPREYACVWTDEPIKIDGRPDESAWGRAPLIDDFVIPWLAKDARPRYPTRARVMWDRDNLYFFASLTDPALVADVTEHNGKVWENDAFEVFLKPAEDKPGYYEFEVNALNTHFDKFFPKRGGGPSPDFPAMDQSQPVPFETAVQKWIAPNGEGGWAVEGKIRWADLGRTGGRPNVDERWRFNLCRCDYDAAGAKADLSTIGTMKRVSFHRHEDYPVLRFAAPDGAARAFGIDRRTPWTTSKLVGYPEPPPPYTIEPAFPKLAKIKQPVFAIEEPGTDDLLIVQHLGNWNGPARILRVRNDPAADATAVVYDGPSEIVYALCFHPDYARNGYVYTFANSPIVGETRWDRVTRFTMDRKTGRLDPGSRLVIIEWESNGHNGGGIEFGPDRMLYLTSGDTTSDSDQAGRGQDLTHLSSAMLRLDVDHPEAPRNYGIPKDNPFVGKKEFADARPEIWAHGFRNPWRMSFDKATGALWVGQNGQDLFEQVYVVHPGENYGWPVYEGGQPFHTHRKLETRTKYTKPLIEHTHADARSLTGGVVYHGDKFPDLAGAYLYGDFSTGRIWAAKYDGHQITSHKEIARTTAQIVNFYADRHGDIFVCDDAAGVFKLAPAPTTTPAPPFPRLLSETGLFADTARHIVQPGLIPYDVNSPLWSDGAAKRRFIALPGDAQLDHTPSRGWNFPEGGATVKTFELELEPGNPKSLRRLETRVMLKQKGNWTGYTYVWNDAQTDAELAPASGLDQTFTIKDESAPTGERKQTWHYPSRFECMVCHSRAANFALGINDAQLDKDFDYGQAAGGRTRVDNQLRTLEHLGVLQVDAFGQQCEQLRKEIKATGVTPDEANKRVAKQTDTTGQREAPKSTLLAVAPDAIPHLIDPYDPARPLNDRARSYLHANCAHCHVEAGGGNASVDLDFFSDPAKTKVFDVPAQANLLGSPDAKLIATGKPELSNLLHRVKIRGTGQMPPAGSNLVDPRGARLLEDWIRGMPATTRPSPN